MRNGSASDSQSEPSRRVILEPVFEVIVEAARVICATPYAAALARVVDGSIVLRASLTVCRTKLAAKRHEASCSAARCRGYDVRPSAY